MSNGPVRQHSVTAPVSALLTVEELEVRFAGIKALTDVSFHVKPGELFAVIGPNGAGKTSLFNVLSRVYQPTSGRVTFNGRDLLRLKAYQVARAGVARTFQSLGQFPTMTVLDYLLLGRHTHMHSGIILGGIYLGPTRSEEKRNRSYCLHLLELLELQHLQHHTLSSLPYGLQKRADLMITIGLDIVLRTAVIMIWASKPIPAASPFTIASGFTFSGIHLGENDLWTIAVTIVLCALLFYFFRYTKYGLAMRATALDQEAALAVGINIRTIYALAWGISAAIATIGGVFLAIDSIAIDPTFGGTALIAFPAIILGGIDSVSGAVVGGIVIGLAQVLTAGYESRVAAILGAGIHEITPYLIMILVLLIRPYGLFGTRKVERI